MFFLLYMFVLARCCPAVGRCCCSLYHHTPMFRIGSRRRE